MTARKSFKGDDVSDLRDRLAVLATRRRALERENQDLNHTLVDSTRHLKEMCDLCDKQRAQISDQQAHIKNHVAEITYLNALIRILVRGASA